ncbi:uncharacterized protein LOC120348563 [Styela clava]
MQLIKMRFYSFVVMMFIVILGSEVATRFANGICVTKIMEGKIVTQGDCEVDNEHDILQEIRNNIAKKQHGENCHFVYNSKCFREIFQDISINFNQAQTTCESIGGKPANIHDMEHYNMIINYLRPRIVPSGRRIVDIYCCTLTQIYFSYVFLSYEIFNKVINCL